MTSPNAPLQAAIDAARTRNQSEKERYENRLQEYNDTEAALLRQQRDLDELHRSESRRLDRELDRVRKGREQHIERWSEVVNVQPKASAPELPAAAAPSPTSAPAQASASSAAPATPPAPASDDKSKKKGKKKSDKSKKSSIKSDKDKKKGEKSSDKSKKDKPEPVPSRKSHGSWFDRLDAFANRPAKKTD